MAGLEAQVIFRHGSSSKVKGCWRGGGVVDISLITTTGRPSGVPVHLMKMMLLLMDSWRWPGLPSPAGVVSEEEGKLFRLINLLISCYFLVSSDMSINLH